MTNGNEYQGGKYAKLLAASEAKVGKSSFLIASALGVLPWQKKGGIVDKPENLFVVSFDTDALGGLKRFLTETCGAPKEALNFSVINLEDDVRKVTETDGDYNMLVYNSVMQAIQHAREQLAKQSNPTAVMHFSSLTGMSLALERGVIGAPKGKGYSDPSKWKALASQLMEVQQWAQLDNWHCIWEAHIDKANGMDLKGDGAAGGAQKDSISVSGKAGRSWGVNCSHTFRIRRNFGTVHVNADGKRTKCDEVYLDTKPTFDFVSTGRAVTESLDAKEPCLTVALEKLGKKVGHWGAR